MKKNDEFSMVNLPHECNDPAIKKDDFKLVQVDAKIHDQKFETKPTTFLKDSIKRFRKNKSSVVATFILGFLVVLSVLVPIVFKTSDIHDTSKSHPEIYYLEPKLFEAGTGFWDGTKKMKNIIVDTNGPEDEWGPDKKLYNRNAISDLKILGQQYTSTPSKYAKDGYLQLGVMRNDEVDYVSFSTNISVKNIASSKEKPTFDDNTYVKENMLDFKINESLTIKEIEQYETMTDQDICVDIFYQDVNDTRDVPDEEKQKWATEIRVDSIELDTKTIGDDIEGTVTVGTGTNVLTKTFTIKVIEKQPVSFKFDSKFEITNFVTYDEERLLGTDEMTKTYPEGYVSGESAIYLTFTKGVTPFAYEIVPYKKVHDIGGTEPAVDVHEIFLDKLPGAYDDTVNDIQLEIRVKNDKGGLNYCTLIQSIGFNYEKAGNAKKAFEVYKFDSGNEICGRENDHAGKWIANGVTSAKYTKQSPYLIKAYMCNFTYDTYEAVLGKVIKKVSLTQLDKMYVTFSAPTKKVAGEWVINKEEFKCVIRNKTKCPLVEEIKPEDCVIDPSTHLFKYANAEVYRYKMEPYKLSSMPKFLLGTDKSGKDMFIYVFEGLRTSLLLGIATSAVCFLFGLFYGAVSGYFGGNVDLALERFTDILSGIPWIVVMTLTIIHLGSTFFTFALALCLTGWIGTAATTRTQFYRFRGREYVLASRTLGASHARLIAKHILPNAMGTIITGAVLMVPSIIFSEATISYLGLGFKNLASLGVILSDNQVELTNHPYLLIFPAVIIALLMISFNLFGNGLRDAVNPSLKGEGE